MKPILVTGATGNTGQAVIAALTARQWPVRAAVLKRRPELPYEQVEFDFTNPATWPAATRDVAGVYLIRPPQMSKVKAEMLPFIQYMAEIQVPLVVFLSVQGAERNPILPHHKIEQYLLESGLTHCCLRPSFFMQNLSTTHRDEIRTYREIRVPAGEGKTNFIDVADIGRVVAKLFAEFEAQPESTPRHRAFTLTGPASYSYPEIATMLSDTLGEPVAYTNPNLFRFWWQQRQLGTPAAKILVMILLYALTKYKMAGKEQPDLEAILGDNGTPLPDFIWANKMLWMHESESNR